MVGLGHRIQVVLRHLQYRGWKSEDVTVDVVLMGAGGSEELDTMIVVHHRRVMRIEVVVTMTGVVATMTGVVVTVIEVVDIVIVVEGDEMVDEADMMIVVDDGVDKK